MKMATIQQGQSPASIRLAQISLKNDMNEAEARAALIKAQQEGTTTTQYLHGRVLLAAGLLNSDWPYEGGDEDC